MRTSTTAEKRTKIDPTKRRFRVRVRAARSSCHNWYAGYIRERRIPGSLSPRLGFPSVRGLGSRVRGTAPRGRHATVNNSLGPSGLPRLDVGTLLAGSCPSRPPFGAPPRLSRLSSAAPRTLLCRTRRANGSAGWFHTGMAYIPGGRWLRFRKLTAARGQVCSSIHRCGGVLPIC